jgi:hypothetical protein
MFVWAMGSRAPLMPPHTVNQRRSLDFILDTLSDGRRFRILCVGRRLQPRVPAGVAEKRE